MGLIEKRAIAKMRDDVVPRYEAELQKIAGDQVSYEIVWDSFLDDIQALENLEEKCFRAINDVFKKITVDEIGTEAVAEQIQKIRISNGKVANIQDFTLKDGVLDMPWDWSGWPGSFYPKTVQEKIETLL